MYNKPECFWLVLTLWYYIIVNMSVATHEKNDNLLFIHPHLAESRVFDPMPPLGMLWIAAVLRDSGNDIHFVDEQVEEPDLTKLAEEMKPSITYIGGTSHSRFRAFAAAAAAKQGHAETTVVYGGPHASFTAQDTIKHISEIDIIVHGEGEKAARELAQWVQSGKRQEQLKNIAGISYRENGGVVSTNPRPVLTQLDDLPLPARDLIPIAKYGQKLEYLGLPALNIITARGCPIACSFCSASRMFGRSYAMRSPVWVVDEVEKLIADYGIKGLKIFDSTFTLNRKHVLDFCTELNRRGLKLPWECEVRVGSVDETLLATMRDAGCYYIDVGIESGDQTTLEAMGKRIQIEEAESLLVTAKRLGIRTKAFFTVGHNGESYDAAKRTVRFIRRLQGKISTVGYNPAIRIYPGTVVEGYAVEKGFMPKSFSWSLPYENRENLRLYRPVDNIPILLQPELGIRELRKLRNRYMRGRLLSPRFWAFKLGLLVRHGELGRYLRLVLRGFGIGRKGKKKATPPQS